MAAEADKSGSRTGRPRRRRRVSPGVARWIDRSAVFLVMVVPTLGLLYAAWLAWRGQFLSTGNLIAFIALWAITLFGIEGGFHRYFSHCAFRTSKTFEALMAIFGSMAFQGPVIWWAANHRRHHRHSDQPGDPHSPQLHGTGLRATVRGLWDAHYGWLYREVDSISRKSHWKEFVPDLLANPVILAIHMHYLWWLGLGLLLPAFLGYAIDGTLQGALMGFLWGGLIRIFLVNHAIWSVNSVCHVFGSRPFALHTRDRSANNVWVALASLGAGWHHNHHVFPGYSTTQVRFWQIDGSGLILRGLAVFGVVRDLRLPPRHKPGWRRRVWATLESSAGSERVAITGLSTKRAFVETRRVCATDESVCLLNFEVREPGVAASQSDVAIERVEAVVEYANLDGMGIRFVSPGPDVVAALKRLGSRSSIVETRDNSMTEADAA